MRLRFPVACLVFCFAALAASAQIETPKTAPTCADLHLVPAVRECSDVKVLVGGDQDLTGFGQPQFAPTKGVEDKFIRDDYYESLKDRVRFHLDATHILFLYAKSKMAIDTMALHHLKFDSEMHNEGYIIAPTKEGFVAVIAETATGLFYGSQTLKQLVQGPSPFPLLYVPTIRDWPAMPHRGLSDDWSRGPLPTMDFLKREIRTLAAYKINIFSPYFEHTFAYAASPVAAFPGGAMTPAEARELVAYAAQYHITVIPEQESFGHLHNVLKFEQFSPLGETPHGAVLAPGDAATLPLIAGWFSELAKVFPGPYAHIGADETFELGLGRTRDAVEQQGLGAVYLDFLKQIHTDPGAQPQAAALLGRHRGQIARTGRHPAQRHDRRTLGVQPPAELQADHRAVYQSRPGDLGVARRGQLEPRLPQQQRGSGQHSRLCARRPGVGLHGRAEHRVER